MPSTSRGYPYPLGSAAPNVPVDLAALANALNTDVGNVAKTGIIVCTSGTRPASPVEGQHIWQTDTKSGMVYTSGAWRRNGVFDFETIGTAAVTEGTTISGITSTSFIAGSPVCGATFIAPPSGGVYVTVSGRISMTTNQNEMLLGWELLAGAVIGSGTQIFAPSSVRAIVAGRAVNASASAIGSSSRRYRVQAGTLTPGSTYNVRTMHLVTPAGTGIVEYRDLLIEPVL